MPQNMRRYLMDNVANGSKRADICIYTKETIGHISDGSLLLWQSCLMLWSIMRMTTFTRTYRQGYVLYETHLYIQHLEHYCHFDCHKSTS